MIGTDGVDFLAGTRVLDLTQFTPGPYATLLLSDFGATVLKIEPPTGDPQRTDGPADSDGLSVWYKLINRNKDVVCLDLKSSEGKEVFAGLLQRADVLVESYRPDVLARLGFPRDRIVALNPGLVHCALSGWGQTGPYRLRPGHDLNYVAFGGALIASGTAEAPVMSHLTVADWAGGFLAATTILAALAGRSQSGRGAHLDVSLAEAVLSWLSFDLTGELRPGFQSRRAVSTYNGGLACYQIYRTSDDRFVTLGIIEAKFWRNFCEAVGQPSWVERQADPVPQHALIAEVAALFRTRTLDQWNTLLESIETCYHPVLAFSELMRHPHVQARRMVDVSEGQDPFAEVLLPLWLDGRPPPRRRAFREVSPADVRRAWDLDP
ncbi:MAG: CoA transferase [Alphaproteobacteria bacterium]|nr:CoA transferase [Alphaproteobacteria bacterium]